MPDGKKPPRAGLRTVDTKVMDFKTPKTVAA
jgi:hypothetical protein